MPSCALTGSSRSDGAAHINTALDLRTAGVLRPRQCRARSLKRECPDSAHRTNCLRCATAYAHTTGGRSIDDQVGAPVRRHRPRAAVRGGEFPPNVYVPHCSFTRCSAPRSCTPAACPWSPPSMVSALHCTVVRADGTPHDTPPRDGVRPRRCAPPSTRRTENVRLAGIQMRGNANVPRPYLSAMRVSGLRRGDDTGRSVCTGVQKGIIGSSFRT